MKAYIKRNKILRRLGFASYADYLTSPLWAEIREQAFQKKGRTCYGCNGYAIQLHHTAYHQGVLSGKDLSDLVPLCRKCHEAIELNPDGTKRDMPEVHKAFRQLKGEKPKKSKAPKRRKGVGCMTCGGTEGNAAVRIGLFTYRRFCKRCRTALAQGLREDRAVPSNKSQSGACDQARTIIRRVLRTKSVSPPGTPGGVG